MTATLVRDPQLGDPSVATGRWRPGPGILVQLGVFVPAVALRLAVILRHGGLHGDFGYDAGVYFAGSDALVHGRLPYRDFVLLHPPGLTLLLTPFALLTRVLSDESAFTVTVLAFTLLGGVNAVLVVRLARRLRLRWRGAAAAGLFYAVWFGAIGSEYLIKLEPVGNLFLLLGLVAALRVRRDGLLRWPLLAGLALGATASVKIWWVVPVAAVLVWLAVRTRSWSRLGAALAGIALVTLLVDGPFLLESPHALWASVVQDQVSRPAISASPLTRLTALSTLTRLTGPLSHVQSAVASLVLLAVSGWAVRRAWQTRALRPVVVLLVLQGVVLLAAPSWFSYYADYLAVAAALTAGGAALPRPAPRTSPVWWRRLDVPPGWVAVLAAAAITASALAVGRPGVRPFPGAAELTRATAGIRCVQSDSPLGLIQLDALSRGFADGCRNWVDVTGRTYGADRSPAPRVGNDRWQRDLTAYLRSGGAVIIVRRRGTGVAPATQRAISRDGVLARAGGHTVYRVAGHHANQSANQSPNQRPLPSGLRK